MACSDYGMLYEAVLDFAFRDAIICGYQNSMGGPAAALLIIGPVGLYLYGKTESMGMLLVMALVTGGVVLPYVAPVGISIVTILAMFVIGVVPVLILWRIGRV